MNNREKALEALENKYRALSILHEEHTFEYDFKNKYFRILDSEVYGFRLRMTVTSRSIYPEFGLRWDELEIIKAIRDLLFIAESEAAICVTK